MMGQGGFSIALLLLLLLLLLPSFDSHLVEDVQTFGIRVPDSYLTSKQSNRGRLELA